MKLKLEFSGELDILTFAQAATDHVCRSLGFGQDVQDAVDLAIRESVINAIKHGNHEQAGKFVTVEFSFTPREAPAEFVVSVRDEGEGFEPEELADPLAPENMLKSSGRGIFFMRSFMDDVRLARHPEGGMEVRMVKKLATA